MLIEKARELGVQLAESPEFIRMRTARKTVDEDEAVSGLLKEFIEKRERLMSSLSESGDAVDALELTRDLERLKQQLNDNPAMAELIESERVFTELINSINHEISACVALPGSNACSGDCSACRGCTH